MLWILAALGAMTTACSRGGDAMPKESVSTVPKPGSFGDDLTFLKAHTSIKVLSSDDGRSQVAIAPDYQGRVMTSSADGPGGTSYGYIHRPGVEAGKPQPHMTVLGGEDRFWLGPEGGQYALYFAPKAAFDTDHWQVPEPIDWGGWPVVSELPREIAFEKTMTLTNYSGATFTLRVNRVVRLLDSDAIARALGQAPATSLRIVGYESDNRITNTGDNAWRRESGLVSIWILGMMRPAPETTVVVPFVAGAEKDLGPVVNDKYFGAIPADRLRVGNGALFFRADGLRRGKIGVPRPRAREVAGSYDPVGHVLTIVQYTLPPMARDYVNSMWEKQTQPYGGDVVNSYNDGPLGPGQPPLGPFYEIESSSPAAALAPGASLQHVHRTIHLEGADADLDAIARALLGVSLRDITSSLATSR